MSVAANARRERDGGGKRRREEATAAARPEAATAGQGAPTTGVGMGQEMPTTTIGSGGDGSGEKVGGYIVIVVDRRASEEMGRRSANEEVRRWPGDLAMAGERGGKAAARR
ncbi:hypothetical protein OsI_07762 [Oryza sativa Indica Group]|uniref:Uncharacterized protein n=1 Tax=Oryza sativa subsp. indica TaxID=39946 RepID=B8AEB1_ORYSI|nr:hypothetical protein OsI_07762 [Oryza sativa Indica Group]